jgi:predicted ATPase/class 3 adenylate cyclase
MVDAGEPATAIGQPQAPPSGTVAWLFTDIAGSTRLLEALGADAYARALADHRRILRDAFARWHGSEIDTQGDSFFVAFPRVSDAAQCALDAQRGLAAHEWPVGGSISVRMAVHAGEALSHEGSYVGMEVHRGARIAAAGYGGQILVSSAAAGLLSAQLPKGATLVDLGEQELKDLPHPEAVFQLSHPDLQATFPPLGTAVSRGKLPVQSSAFIGREDAIREIDELLADPDVRLVTLVGPGGTGKTRLALRVAETATPHFPDGVFFVDLAPANDTSAALPLIVQALGKTLSKEQSAIDFLKRLLAETTTLILLDNFEQVTVAAGAVAELLQACARLTLLVTSREPLHIRAEHVFPVPAMALPPAGVLADNTDAGAFEAIQLFVERARAVKPDFRMTDENASAIVDICRRLDGLPLAIELATARLKLFSPESLRDRLSRSLDLLKGGPRDLPERQQTIHDTIDWSYQLLEPGEQQLFEILAVFSTSTYPAIEQVVSSCKDTMGESPDVLDGIASLLDKSLLRRASAEAERVVMLETIREYAAERLRQRPALEDAARRAHAEFFAALAAGAVRGTPPPREDIENLRSAWRYGTEHGDLALLDAMDEGLWHTYEAVGLYRATIDQATELLSVLDLAPASPDQQARKVEVQIRRLNAMLIVIGYTPEVEQAAVQAIALFEEGHAGVDQMFSALRLLAGLYELRMEFDKSIAIAGRILKLADDRDDGEMRASAHLLLGVSASFVGNLKGANANFDETLAWYAAHPPTSGSRAASGVHTVIAAHNASALNLHLLGFSDQAADRAHRGIELATRLGQPHTLAYANYHTGFLYLWRQQPTLVLDHARAVFEAIGKHEIAVWRALGQVLMGAANVALGAADEGIAQLDTALETYQGLRTPPIFWPLLQLIQATAYAQAGRAGEAITILDEASSIPAYGELPQFKLARGMLLLATAEPAAAQEAGAHVRTAYEASAQYGILMTQLQAAVVLRQLGLASGTDDGLAELRSTYDLFTEGFEIPDLVAARELLATPPS